MHSGKQDGSFLRHSLRRSSISIPHLADFIGPVVSILVGDTIQVLHNTHPECVHLSGIHCPEKGQYSANKRSKLRPRWFS
jgi:endonuclease YncB( thermonuclease family)